MKRLLTLLTLTMLLTAVIPAKASAAPFEWFSIKIENKTAPALPVIQEQPKAEPQKVEPPKAPEPVVYLVVEGDNLSKIGTAYNVEWQRLWAKNTQLTNPDLIHVGDKITIPEPSEPLTREIPAAIALPAITPGVAPLRDYSGGNTYNYGYCTWHVKNMRTDLPNNLGNADTWYYRAKAQGLPTGTEARVGAAAQTRGQMHVAYVTAVNGDGTVTVSEMNVVGWNVQSYATYPATKFLYIY